MTRARRGKVVAGGVGGLALGLAFATVVLPQLADTLRPTAFGIAVVTACLGLVTAVSQYRRARLDRAADIETALEFPPCPLHTPRLEVGGVGSTRPNPQMVAAMRGPRRAVIVRGPREADKYSAALTAARVALPGFVVLVPFDADGLATVQDNDFAVGVHRSEAGLCVWLENLDRFLDTVDPRAFESASASGLLEWLRRTPTEIRLIATIEERRWDELSAGTDQPAETLRRLERIAEVVDLGSAGDVADVTPPLAHEQVTEAEILVSDAKPDDPDPSTAEAQARREARGRLLRRDGWFVASVVIAVLAILTPFGLYFLDRRGVVQAPPITDQMASIIGDMQRQLGHGHVVLDERVSLHDTEQDSWIVGVAHGDGAPGDPTVRARRSAIGCTLTYDSHAPSYVYGSDEIRVYDVHDGWLDEELDFQPTLLGSQAASLSAVDQADANNGLYENGVTPQFIAGYSVGGCVSPMIVPFAIQWDNQRNPPRYDLKGLTEFSRVTAATEAPVAGPAFATRDVPAHQADFLRSTYSRLVSLRNAAPRDGSDTRAMSAYPVSAFAVTLQPSGRLLLGYQLAPFDFERTNTLELEVGQLRSGGIAVFPCMQSDHTCTGPPVPEEIHVPPDRSADHALLLAWPVLERHWVNRICETSAGAAHQKHTKVTATCIGPAG